MEAIEQRIHPYLTLASISLGLSVAGIFASPWWGLLSVVPTVYTTMPVALLTYRDAVQEGRIGISAYDLIISAVALSARNFFVASLSSFAFYLSRKLLMRAQDRFHRGLVRMVNTQPREVWILRQGLEVQIPFDQVRIGDVVVARAGEITPIDGVVARGDASLDQSIVTGETRPIDKTVGDPVYAFSVVLSGRLDIRVEKTGHATLVSRVEALLQHTANLTHSIESRSEAWANRMALPMLGMSGLALPFLGPSGAAALLNSCPGWYLHVLAPFGMISYLNAAMQRGILVKDGRALDRLKRVDTVVFDKTGTLTQGPPSVGAIYTHPDYTADEVLQYAAMAESRQPHHIAVAIRQAASERGLAPTPVDQASYAAGYGVTARIGEPRMRIGSARFIRRHGAAIPEAMRIHEEAGFTQGYSYIYVARDAQVIGMIELQARLRPEARDVIRQLRERQLSLIILSGDHPQPTQHIARSLGINEFAADKLPEDKAHFIIALRQAGKSVCFIGDGINDALALQHADVSIALRDAASTAVDSAQIVLMNQGSAN